jgi:hypothetical protein
VVEYAHMSNPHISIIETDKATIITVPKTPTPPKDHTEAVSFADLTGALADDPELKGKTAREAEHLAHNLWTQAIEEEHDDTHTS